MIPPRSAHFFAGVAGSAWASGLRAAFSRSTLTAALTLATCASAHLDALDSFSGAWIWASSMSSVIPASTNFLTSALTRARTQTSRSAASWPRRRRAPARPCPTGTCESAASARSHPAGSTSADCMYGMRPFGGEIADEEDLVGRRGRRRGRPWYGRCRGNRSAPCGRRRRRIGAPRWTRPPAAGPACRPAGRPRSRRRLRHEREHLSGDRLLADHAGTGGGERARAAGVVRVRVGEDERAHRLVSGRLRDRLEDRLARLRCRRPNRPRRRRRRGETSRRWRPSRARRPRRRRRASWRPCGRGRCGGWWTGPTAARRARRRVPGRRKRGISCEAPPRIFSMRNPRSDNAAARPEFPQEPGREPRARASGAQELGEQALGDGIAERGSRDATGRPRSHGSPGASTPRGCRPARRPTRTGRGARSSIAWWCRLLTRGSSGPRRRRRAEFPAR